MSPKPRGMHLSIDLDRYLHLPTGTRARFDAWLDAEHLTDRHVIALTLGEGQVVIERAKQDENGHIVVQGDDVVYVTEVVPVRGLPPVEAFRSEP